MITSELFGTAPCGTPVLRYTLNGPEICVRIMDYGATVLGIDVPDIPGNVRDVVLGFDKLEDYFDNPACFGATIGPVANRTAGATITIDGTDWHMPANEGVNNLHSDLEHGLHKRADGKVTLAIPKASEVAVFRTNPSWYWLTPNRAPKVPVTLIIGEDSIFLKRRFPQQIKSRLRIPYITHAGGHMFPLEHPESVSEQVLALIEKQLSAK